MRHFNSLRGIHLISLALFGLAVFLRILPGERTIDDAYITFRYAHNLVTGAGFVYNLGERILGTTTPLYTLLMAGLALLLRTENYPALALWVNALADGLTCALLGPLGYLMSGQHRVGIAAGVLYAIAPFSVTFAIGGMETSVFVLFLVLTALFYLKGTHAWALSAALALLTRPDALIFIGPIGLDFAVRWLTTSRSQRSFAFTDLIKPTLMFLAPVMSWALFATLYFGSPLPHSIAAKATAYKLGSTEALLRLLQQYSSPFFENLTFPTTQALIVFLIGYFTLTLGGLLRAFKHNSRTLSINLYPFLYLTVFAVANPLIFRWYLTPPLPFYILLILNGLDQITNGIGQLITRTFKSVPATASFLFVVPCLAFAFMSGREWKLQPRHGPQQPAPDMAYIDLEEIYAQVGKELVSDVNSQTVIAAGDIGALGYFSHATILDTLGLISPQSTHYYPLPSESIVTNYAISADLIAAEQPDYVVFPEVYGRLTLLNDPRFLTDYALRKKIATDIYGSDGMLVYERLKP